MDANSILNYLSQYGVLFIFIIVFLEYLNLPGLPAGSNNAVRGMDIKRRNEFSFCVNIIGYSWSNWKLGLYF